VGEEEEGQERRLAGILGWVGRARGSAGRNWVGCGQCLVQLGALVELVCGWPVKKFVGGSQGQREVDPSRWAWDREWGVVYGWGTVGKGSSFWWVGSGSWTRRRGSKFGVNWAAVRQAGAEGGYNLVTCSQHHHLW